MTALSSFCSPKNWVFGENIYGVFCTTRALAKRKINIQGRLIYGLQCDVFLNMLSSMPSSDGYLLKVMLVPTSQLIEDRVCRNKTEIKSALSRFGLGYLIS